MAKDKNSKEIHGDGTDFDIAGAHIMETPLSQEVETSFLEYAYSVITDRALPDARDGLKPVHRRILFSMIESGLKPDHAYVKSARVVGDAMGKYHPHGDMSIYDAMVRMAQPFALNVPFVDGHGNFGSLNDSPAASRYTEARLTASAMLMVSELDEGTVSFIGNYDGSLQEPTILPAAYPNLLVNGSEGIAVGMATKMIPHNLGEIVNAARLLLKKPSASLDELMTVVPGPDLPTGGTIIGLDQVRLAYETGKGAIRIRGKAEIEPLAGSKGRMSIVITELPYAIGTEKLNEKIIEEIAKKRLVGIANARDLSDRIHGTRFVVECKTGVNPQALLSELYRLTPLEIAFGIANLALVNGKPETLGLKSLLEVFIAHRTDVVTKRTQFRLAKAEARKHIVDGLLIALDNIDAVVKTIRASKDTADAREALMKKFKLSEIQTNHILETPLRRLVALEVEALKKELVELKTAIAGFNKILGDEKELHKVIDRELGEVADKFGTPRKTFLVEGDLKDVIAASAPAGPLEVEDDPCTVFLSATGLLARSAASSEESTEARKKKGRTKHDALLSVIETSARSQVLLITNKGRAFRVNVLDLPALPDSTGPVNVRGGVSAREVAALTSGETVVGIASISATPNKLSPGIAMGTRLGAVKVVTPEWPTRSGEFEIISLKPGDEVLSAKALADGSEELVFVTTDAQLLHFPAKTIRPQGRSGSGMAGVKLDSGQFALTFAVIPRTTTDNEPMVVTFTGVAAKVTPLSVYPGKGRATGGVRCQKFTKGAERLTLAWVGSRPGAGTDKGEPLDLPDVDQRRDGSGTAWEGLQRVGHLIERA
jgi:DNA gyrase subunit A